MKKSAYKIGITGHRDLKKSSIKYYQNKVHTLLLALQEKQKYIIVYSPLADGSDRLIVKEAIKLNIPYIAVLPIPIESYVMDFNEKSKEEFLALLDKSNEVITLTLCKGNTLENIAIYGKERDAQYEAVGYKIADISDRLIALWDGKQIDLKGGTGEIVEYFKEREKGILSHLLVARNGDSKSIMVKFKHFNMGYDDG